MTTATIRVCVTKGCPAEGMWTARTVCSGCGKGTVKT
jgi:rRNA maturation protein Nop10